MPRRSRIYPIAVWFIASVIGITRGLEAQAVQAVRGMDDQDEVIDSLARVVANRLAVVEATRASEQAFIGKNAELHASQRDFLEAFVTLARQTLDAVDDSELFLRGYYALDVLSEQYADRLVSPQFTASQTREVQTQSRELATAVRKLRVFAPGGSVVLHKVPGVVFVGGAALTFHAGETVFAPEVSTNLVGAAAGSAFKAIGSTALEGYFEDNLTVGTAFPTSQGSGLTATLSVGLGSVSLGTVAIFPAISIEQVDSSDSRLPRTLLTANPAKSWSSPLIGFGFAPFRLKDVPRRSSSGQLSPIITFSLRLPYYYAGDPFSALAALFSASGGDFRQQGKVMYQVGIFLPLQKVEPICAGPAQ
jgi:hypothetical protein